MKRRPIPGIVLTPPDTTDLCDSLAWKRQSRVGWLGALRGRLVLAMTGVTGWVGRHDSQGARSLRRRAPRVVTEGGWRTASPATKAEDSEGPRWDPAVGVPLDRSISHGLRG